MAFPPVFGHSAAAEAKSEARSPKAESRNGIEMGLFSGLWQVKTRDAQGSAEIPLRYRQDAAAEKSATELPQPLEGKLEAHLEHEKHDTQLSEQLDVLWIFYETGAVGADNASCQEEADDRGNTRNATDSDHRQGDAEQDDDV